MRLIEIFLILLKEITNMKDLKEEVVWAVTLSENFKNLRTEIVGNRIYVYATIEDKPKEREKVLVNGIWYFKDDYSFCNIDI